MSRAWYRFILKVGVYASLVSLFLVNKHFYFPYITSKQLYFNILIEILTVVWLAYIIKYPSERPKKSWLTIGWAVYLLIVLITCFTGVDFNLSFWGDLERMLGWFPLFHFFLLYLIVVTVFRNWRDWQPLLIAMVSAGTLLSLIGLFQNYNASTLGNAAYMGTLMLMTMFITALLIGRSRNWLVSLPYWLVLILLFVGFVRADISGAYAGLAVGILVYAGLMTFLNHKKKVRQWGLVVVGVLVIGVGLLFAFRWSPALDNTQLGKVIRDFSLENPTLNTRFYSWKWAWRDLGSHPLLGVGHGNYALVFDRQFKGDFYRFSKGEDFFDRAHNNVVEIATTTGLLGLAAYLFMFTWAVIYLIKAYREDKIKLPEFAALAAFLASYFVQNLALFDCLASYIFLMIILGLINNLYHRPERDKKEKDQGWISKEIWVLVGGGLLMAWLIWATNITTIKMLNGTIDGIIEFNQGRMMQGLETFKKAHAEGSPLVRDSRSAMINSLLSTSYYLDNLTDVQRTAIFSYAIDQGKKNLEYNPKDNFLNMQLAQLLELASQASRNNLSVSYAREGLQYVEKSIENGREHILPYYVKAQLLMDLNQIDEAIATLKEALAISTDYWDTYCHLSRTELQAQVNVTEAYDFLDKCLDKGGATLLGPGNYLNEAIKHYDQAGDIDRLTMLTEQLARIYPQGAEIWLRLADLYHQQGRDDEARYAAQQAVSLKPEYKAQVEEILGTTSK